MRTALVRRAAVVAVSMTALAACTSSPSPTSPAPGSGSSSPRLPASPGATVSVRPSDVAPVPPGDGAAVLGPRAEAAGFQPQATSSRLQPSPAQAGGDTTMPGSGCHASSDQAAVERCVLHDGAGRRVLLAGDSHAGQWMPAFRELAAQRDWHLEMATKSSCPLIEVPLLSSTMQPYTTCASWVGSMMAQLTGAGRPDVVVVSHSNYLQFLAGGGAMRQRKERLVAAETATLKRLQDAGMTVVVLHDTPEFAMPVPRCLLGNPRNYLACGDKRPRAVSRGAAGQTEVARRLGAQLVDLTDIVCPHDFCPAVIGNVVVWRDTNHMTASYAATTAPFLESVFPNI